MKPLSILLIALLVIQAFVDAKSVSDATTHSVSAEDGGGNVLESLVKKQINCGKACSRRCSKSSRKKVCLRACKSCCATCNCVPPGTYGNKAVCPCYASLTTHGNKPKCP